MKMFAVAVMLLGATYGFSQGKVRMTHHQGALKSVVADQKTAFNMLGVVHKDKCGTWIEVKDERGHRQVHPVDLPKEFDNDGKLIRFDYAVTPMNVKKECGAKEVYVQNVHHARAVKGTHATHRL